jgi:arylsulfatase A-like enzyme
MHNPTRRDLLKSAPLLASAAAAQNTADQSAPSAQASKSAPNIVILISDQFRADNLGCMGMNPMELTPNFDAMARRGVLFRSAVVNHPVCAPARATLFTGVYEEKHAVWHNGPGLQPGSVTLATLLRGRGYSANYIGKWHLALETNTPESHGPVAPEMRGGFLDLWEAANVLELTSHAYEGNIYDAAGKPIPFSGIYRDDFLTQRGVEFLRRAKPPFLLVVSYLNTHHQNDTDDYVPPREFANKFRNPFVPQDLRPLPGSWPSQLGDYYGCVANIDAAAGTILATLKQQGFDSNTIVLFTSDHGCHFKTRNTEYKRSPHESSIHVPLIVQGPGFDRGLELRQLVSHVDVTPMLLEAAGVPVPAQMQGRSLMPLVEGRAEGWRDEVYIHLSEFMTGRVLRTPRFTYAVAAPKVRGWHPVPDASQYIEYMMYDLAADPFQHVNLAGRAETQQVSAELRERLLARIAEAGGGTPSIEPAQFPYP